ncbi:hypothetical protein NOL12_03140 [Streptococcus suis]|nr:hypothetical protein [Streptococcus suis]
MFRYLLLIVLVGVSYYESKKYEQTQKTGDLILSFLGSIFVFIVADGFFGKLLGVLFIGYIGNKVYPSYKNISNNSVKSNNSSSLSLGGKNISNIKRISVDTLMNLKGYQNSLIKKDINRYNEKFGNYFYAQYVELEALGKGAIDFNELTDQPNTISISSEAFSISVVLDSKTLQRNRKIIENTKSSDDSKLYARVPGYNELRDGFVAFENGEKYPLYTPTSIFPSDFCLDNGEYLPLLFMATPVLKDGLSSYGFEEYGTQWKESVVANGLKLIDLGKSEIIHKSVRQSIMTKSGPKSTGKYVDREYQTFRLKKFIPYQTDWHGDDTPPSELHDTFRFSLLTDKLDLISLDDVHQLARQYILSHPDSTFKFSVNRNHGYREAMGRVEVYPGVPSEILVTLLDITNKEKVFAISLSNKPLLTLMPI